MKLSERIRQLPMLRQLVGRPALREYAAMCNDPSGFEDRKYVDEAHAKTRPLDDCVATRTGRLLSLIHI
mgnify:CR=1 FL=1